MPSIIIAHSCGLSLLPHGKDQEKNSRNSQLLTSQYSQLTMLSASNGPALISWTLSFMSVMTGSLKQLGYSLPPGSFFFFLMLCVSSCFSPNSPLSLNCSIVSTLTSRICDLSSAKPLFLKSLLWTFFPPVFLLLIKPCFLSLFFLYSLFHDFIQNYIDSVLTTLKFLYLSGPLFQSLNMCIYLTVCSPLSVFSYISSASTVLWVLIVCLSKYSHFIFALLLTLCSYDCWRDSLKSWVKSCHSPAQKSCTDSLFQP